MRVNENLSKNGIGVEVSDFSLADLTQENISFLRSKWVKYGLIIFPKLPLSHDEFKDFALSFGDFGDDPFISSLQDLVVFYLYSQQMGLLQKCDSHYLTLLPFLDTFHF